MDFINRIDKDISLLLDNLPVGIIRFNDKRQCIYVNKFIIDLFSLETNSNNPLDNISSTYFKLIHKEDRDIEIETCNRFMVELKECNTTIRVYNRKLKEYRWFTNKRTVIYNVDNKASFMYTFQDINENKLLEIKLQNESIKAERAYNHKSIFLSNWTHELRTPLNGIIGMLTLLEDTRLSNDQQDYISMVKECSYNLMTIINDILDYSKLEVGKITLDMKTMNIGECVESANDILISKIYEKSLEYSFNIDSNIPEYICGDTNRIKQILLNLLSNSIKFTDRGNIFINVECITQKDYDLLKTTYYNEFNESFDEKDDQNTEYDKHNVDLDDLFNDYNYKKMTYIRFDITDTGCGIDPKDKKKLFKPFSQIDNQISTKIYSGTGLGLTISKELVELMGGFIWLDWSEISRGSRFSFVLPTVIGERDIENTNNIYSENILENAVVLVVDDNLYNRISLTAIVTKWGMKPYVFSNGEEALHFTKLSKFDIGLIDICMPKMDGQTFAAKLYDQNEFKKNQFPLVALSSLGDKNISKSKHFKTHIIKPIKESKLKKICIDLLKNRVVRGNDLQNKTSITDKTIDRYIDQNNLNIKSDLRILLAEDVYINQKVVTSFLNKLGYDNIQVVENGKQCLDLAINNQFDIILLDIRMPIMNGEVVLQELNKYYSNTNLTIPYIIAVTAYCLREDKQRYLDMGFDDYIPKPITISELKLCLDKFMQKILNN